MLLLDFCLGPRDFRTEPISPDDKIRIMKGKYVNGYCSNTQSNIRHGFSGKVVVIERNPSDTFVHFYFLMGASNQGLPLNQGNIKI